jgi:hypothetical protein
MPITPQANKGINLINTNPRTPYEIIAALAANGIVGVLMPPTRSQTTSQVLNPTYFVLDENLFFHNHVR